MPAMQLTIPAGSQQDAILTALGRIEQRLATVEDALARATAPVAQVTATAVDVLDDLEHGLRERGVDLDERVRTTLALLEQLSDQDNAQALLQLLSIARQLPQALAVVTDTLDHHLGRAGDAGIDLGERVQALLKVAERLTTPAALGLAETLVGHLPNLQDLLDSGVLAAGALQTIGRAGDALTRAAELESQPVGALGLLRALRDPDTQRALGFALSFARIFGRTLGSATPTPALPAETNR